MEVRSKANIQKYMELMLLLVAIWIQRADGEKSCGKLKCVFEGSKTRLRWYPDSWLSSTNDAYVGHQWLKDGRRVNFSDRITYDNIHLVVTIFNFTKEDEGIYKVQCRAEYPNFPFSEELNVKLPVTSHTSTSIQQVNTTPDGKHAVSSPVKESVGIDSSVAIVVLSVCVVIIVIVISGTVILVCRRRLQREEDHQRLAEKIESPLTSRVDGDGASVYNEIDVGYESSSSRYVTHGLSESPKALISPSLPKRWGPAEKTAPRHNTANKHTVQADITTNADNKGTYINMKSKDKTVAAKDLKNVYASVIPKDKRLKGDKATEEECSYAKPIPKKDRVPAGQASGSEQGRYSVTFPKIDMSKLSIKIAEKDVDLVSLNEENFEAAICRSGVYRSQKRKSSKQRQQLNYVEIDHSVTETNTFIPNLPNPQEKLEYVSIDFEKKAFVAPVRKPPSSWYKRRNKKNRY